MGRRSSGATSKTEGIHGRLHRLRALSEMNHGINTVHIHVHPHEEEKQSFPVEADTVSPDYSKHEGVPNKVSAPKAAPMAAPIAYDFDDGLGHPPKKKRSLSLSHDLTKEEEKDIEMNTLPPSPNMQVDCGSPSDARNESVVGVAAVCPVCTLKNAWSDDRCRACLTSLVMVKHIARKKKRAMSIKAEPPKARQRRKPAPPPKRRRKRKEHMDIDDELQNLR